MKRESLRYAVLEGFAQGSAEAAATLLPRLADAWLDRDLLDRLRAAARNLPRLEND